MIATNRRALHDYSIEQHYECGLSLQGWEVKAIRDGKVNIAEAHALIRNGEAWLLGSRVTPLASASTHINPEPDRSRKLLLTKKEISHLIGAVDRQGYTLVPLSLYWRRGRVKLDLGLARGRKSFDKRQLIKSRDWSRQQARLLRHKH